MFILSTVLILLASVILILIVLVQNSKGGGLSSSFGGGGGSQMGGAVQTNQFLEKATWTLAIALLVFSITASVAIPNAGQSEQNSVISAKVQDDFSAIPVIPTNTGEVKTDEKPAE